MGKLPLAGTAEGEFCLAGRLKIDKIWKNVSMGDGCPLTVPAKARKGHNSRALNKFINELHFGLEQVESPKSNLTFYL